jgi:beta-galactosidase
MVGKWGNFPPRTNALQTTADLHLDWDVPYAPGVLRAVGTMEGQPATIFEMRTTGAPAAIRLSTDRAKIATGRGDLAHVKVEIVDHDGLVVPTAEDEVGFDLQGKGRILGVDNGRPDSHESYQANKRKAFNGLALVLLQSAGGAGSMVLTASAPSLKGAQIQVTAE